MHGCISEKDIIACRLVSNTVLAVSINVTTVNPWSWGITLTLWMNRRFKAQSIQVIYLLWAQFPHLRNGNSRSQQVVERIST